MAFSFQIEAQLPLKNVRFPSVFLLDSGTVALAVALPQNCKPHKSAIVLVGKFLKKPEYLGPRLRCAEYIIMQ